MITLTKDTDFGYLPEIWPGLVGRATIGQGVANAIDNTLGLSSGQKRHIDALKLPTPNISPSAANKKGQDMAARQERTLKQKQSKDSAQKDSLRQASGKKQLKPSPHPVSNLSQAVQEKYLKSTKSEVFAIKKTSGDEFIQSSVMSLQSTKKTFTSGIQDFDASNANDDSKRKKSKTVEVPAKPKEVRGTGKYVSPLSMFYLMSRMFHFPFEGTDVITVTWEDYEHLDPGEMLNDSIIRFYLRYLLSLSFSAHCIDYLVNGPWPTVSAHKATSTRPSFTKR